MRLWRIDGDKRVLIRDNRGHHTHGLIVDASGHLVWEESRYDPATGDYTEVIWELGPRGPVARFGPLKAPPMGLGIARDAQGCTYRVDQPGRAGPALAYRRCPGRPAERLVGSVAAAAAFRPILANDVAGVAFSPDGRFLFRQGGTVHSIDRDGRIRLVAGRLSSDNFGIGVDPQGRLLVAEFDRRRVIRIAGAHREVVATAPAGWAPTGVATGPDGRIYILEASLHVPGQPLRMQVRALRDGRATLIARLTVPS